MDPMLVYEVVGLLGLRLRVWLIIIIVILIIIALGYFVRGRGPA